MPNYVLFSILAATSFALSSTINKFASKHGISNNWVFLFYYYLSALPFILLVPLLFNVSVPTAASWPFVILYGLAFFIGNIFFTAAIYHLDASTFAPFFQLQSAFIALLAFLFLAERFLPVQYLFIGLMLVGAILVTLDERMRIKTFFRWATLLIILQQLFHALSNLFAGFALNDINSFSFLFWGDLTSFGFALLLIPFLGNRLRVPFSQVKPLLFSGFFAVVGATSLFTAFQANLTISSALSLLTSPIVLGLAFLASTFKPHLLEHHTRKVYLVRAIGVTLVLVAALQLGLNG